MLFTFFQTAQSKPEFLRPNKPSFLLGVDCIEPVRSSLTGRLARSLVALVTHSPTFGLETGRIPHTPEIFLRHQQIASL